ncbi:hypothetical protein FW778_17945 [Ginsengibacter hankyongi]|uniref:Uncharacterized protein n=1 Tax=Ginsengibacter hankyongi TaxID=2607284 RepID=A0A5J5IDV5_9BACT|nr:hypothetical protein [Ginsengibacter hankyongi]KAA9036502.1 hypothetical protein FW778_17945 [Ginsengibacter hankyongi]
MLRYFKTFFYPDTLTYSYNQSKETVLAKIEEVLKRKVTFLSSNDMKGRFLNSDTFAIDTISPAYTRGVKYSSTLIGQVVELGNETTQIKTKAKPSMALYFLFFVTIIFGIAYLYKFIQTGSTSFLFWSLAMLIIGPALSIGFSNVAIASIRERYRMYIDKELTRPKKSLQVKR